MAVGLGWADDYSAYHSPSVLPESAERTHRGGEYLPHRPCSYRCAAAAAAAEPSRVQVDIVAGGAPSRVQAGDGAPWISLDFVEFGKQAPPVDAGGAVQSPAAGTHGYSRVLTVRAPAGRVLA